MLEIHDHVSGVVRLLVAMDVHDARIPELGQGARLLEEAAQTLAKEGGMVPAEFDPRTIMHPRRPTVGEVLLDRHGAIEAVVPRLIGDPEAPSPDQADDAEVAHVGADGE